MDGRFLAVWVYGSTQVDRAKSRLNFLLKQTELLQHFATDRTVSDMKK